jgi:mannose-6-phosphate isomerase
MALEFACTNVLRRPWGVLDLSPWNRTSVAGLPTGEVWYERPGQPATAPSLLLKLLFTSQPLSIQVHPDDIHAQAMGLAHGKTEVWYVLSATPGAKVALGLNRRVTPQQLRCAANDGSIADLLAWRTVAPNDVVSVPAGTIHAIGAGLVIAEVQQRSDVTFRLFDYGRQRELHLDDAIAVANTGPADVQVPPSRLTEERTLLVSNPHFVFERIELPSAQSWSLEAEREVWVLLLRGDAVAGSYAVAKGDGIFAHSEHVEIRTGALGMTGVVAYAAHSPLPNLLQRRTQPGAEQRKDLQIPTFLSRGRAGFANGRSAATQ